jgi:hypothetical protein
VHYGAFGGTFDSFVESPHNSRVTVRHLIIRRRGLVSGIVVAAFAVAMFADCVSAAQTTAEQKACCAAMVGGCGPQSNAHPCCTTEAPRVDQSAAAHRVTVASPVSIVAIATFDSSPVSTTARGAAPARDRHGARPPGVLPHVLNSVFRV